MASLGALAPIALLTATPLTAGGCTGDSVPWGEARAAPGPVEPRPASEAPTAQPTTTTLAVRLAGVPEEIRLRVRLEGPQGDVRMATTPVTLCGAAPGRWTVAVMSPGWSAKPRSIKAKVGQTAWLRLKPKRVGTLAITAPEGRAALVLPGGRHQTVSLPFEDAAMEPGLYRVDMKLPGQTLAAAIVVEPGQRAELVAPTEGAAEGAALPGSVFVGATRLVLGAGVKTRTYKDEGAASFYTGSRANLLRPRADAAGDVGSLWDLRSQVRAIVVESTSERDAAAAVAALADASRAAHFVIDWDGTIHQTADIYDRPRGRNRLDRVAISVVLNNPMVQIERVGANAEPPSPPYRRAVINGQLVEAVAYSPEQVQALGRLVRVMSETFMIISPDVPRGADGSPRTQAFPGADRYRGVLAGYHVDQASVSPGPSLDWGQALQSAAGPPPAAAPGLPTTAFDAGTPVPFLALVRSERRRVKVTLSDPAGVATEVKLPHVVCEPAEGTRTLAAHARHHQPLSQSVQVAAGRATHVKVAMQALGGLRLTGGPPSRNRNKSKTKGTLWRPDGTTSEFELPYREPDMPVGNYRIRVPLPDGSAYVAAIRIERGRVARLDVPRKMRKHRSIVVGGKRYPLAGKVKVVPFDASRGMSFHAAEKKSGKRFVPLRKLGDNYFGTLEQAQEIVHMAVLHADLLRDARATFNLLVDRGLSTHFIIDWDGTIYQTTDVLHTAFGAGDPNPVSVQIDLNNWMRDLVQDPKGRPFPPEHRKAMAMGMPINRRPLLGQLRINGQRVQSYGYTDRQYASLIELLRTLGGVFPRIQPEMPMDGDTPRLDFYREAIDFDGIVAHWHISPNRWDPGPAFEWLRVRDGLAGVEPRRAAEVKRPGAAPTQPKAAEVKRPGASPTKPEPAAQQP